MQYEIKRAGPVGARVNDPDGQHTRAIMGVDVVQMSFSMPQAVDIRIGDYVDVYGRRFWLNTIPNVKKELPKFEYSCEFQGKAYELGKVQYLTLDTDNELNEAEFSITGTADVFIDLIIRNANRGGAGWSKGVILPTTEKTLTFSGENCLAVLSRLAEEFETEWWVDDDGTIHLSERKTASGHLFVYGKNNGLYDISRTNPGKELFTVLIARGGTRNIPANYRGYSSRLKLPAPLERNVDKFGRIERTEIFDDIFPSFEGTVKSVSGLTTFRDPDIDFDVWQQQVDGGGKIKVVFQSGDLAGLEFELEKFDWNTKEFTIIPISDKKADNLPSDRLKVKAGDKYTLVDLIMPQAYIDAAEAKLLARAQALLEANSELKVNYVITPNLLYFKKNNISLSLGQTVHIKDADLGIDREIRIVSLSRSLKEWYNYTIELSDTVVAVPPMVKNISRIEAAERAIRINQLSDPARAKLNWQNMQELMHSVVDTEGNYYTDKIKPLSIETKFLAVGARSQQLTLDGVIATDNYLGNPARIRFTAGVLNHLTITNDDTIRSWNIAAYAKDDLIDTAGYYVYAKCERSGSSGVIALSIPPIPLEQDPNYYHFEIGFLNKVRSGFRRYNPTYGGVDIYGRTIHAGVIEGNGLSIDLDAGIAIGRFQFGAGSSGLENVAGYDMLASKDFVNAATNGLAGAISDAQAAAASAQTAANNANTLLNKWSNDNILDPSEKQDIYREWLTIQADYPKQLAKASKYGISAATYTSYYNVLANYINPLLSNLTTESNINGSTFRTTFVNYYNSLAQLLKDISDVAYVVEVSRFGTTVIENGQIRTNLINTNALIVAGGLETTSGAQAKASAAQAAAQIAAQGYANVAQSNAAIDAQARINSFASTLGGLAYSSVVTQAMLEGTIIIGGYVKTSLIDANFIKAQVINTTYIEGLTLNFVQGTIGGWSISNDYLRAGTVNPNQFIVLKGGTAPYIYLGNNPGINGTTGITNTTNNVFSNWSGHFVYSDVAGQGFEFGQGGFITSGSMFNVGPEIGTKKAAVVIIDRNTDTHPNQLANRQYSALYVKANVWSSLAIQAAGDCAISGALVVDATLSIGEVGTTSSRPVGSVPLYWDPNSKKLYR